jgi:hypothetical protein
LTPNSRSYLNRWIQPDSIIPEASQGVQAWDHYAYANNSPVRYNDPTGHAVGPAIHDSYGDAACLDPDHCLDATGMSILSQSSKDVSISRVRIGARSATQPSLTGPYSGQPIDNTCFNCSAEPQLPGIAGGVAAAPDVGNFFGATALNYMAAYGPEAIFLYAYVAEYSNGNVSVDTLEVVNTTSMDISVMNTTFNVTGSPSCAGTCIGPYNGSYRVVPGPSIGQSGGNYGLEPIVGSNSIGYVNLTQPGGGNRPSNLFYGYQNVTMAIFIANTATGTQWAPVIYPIR